MVTDLVQDMTLDDALKVSRGDVADALDGLPPINGRPLPFGVAGLLASGKEKPAAAREDAGKPAVLRRAYLAAPQRVTLSCRAAPCRPSICDGPSSYCAP